MAVAATSPGNAWAVGTLNYQHTLIVHWNGKAWKQQPSPDPYGQGNVLQAVAATSPTDAWAVGFTSFTGPYGGQFRIIEHWNGKVWTAAPIPAVVESDSALFGVTALSATDAWAVGDTLNGQLPQTLIEHWNGKAWKVQPTHIAGSLAGGVAATSPTNAWAVGLQSFANNNPSSRTLILHWNGTAWKVQPSPNPHGAYLAGVAATSPTNAWTVGYTKGVRSAPRTLVEHWNGKTWKVQPSPDPAGSYPPNSLAAVTALSATDAWAVGGKGGRGKSAPGTLILHWNGRAWKAQPAPSPGPGTRDTIGYGLDLNGVAATSTTHGWAVGDAGGAHRLILHWNGTAWR